MAIRQYIGARYVLKIYENSLNPQSADWEAGVYYEPLVMVNYNNSSYISRKDVPPTVGDPVSNPTYWALSGLYNGQIAQLQNEIDDINGDILSINGDLTTLNGFMSGVKASKNYPVHNVMIITDSYGARVNGSSQHINEVVAQRTGLTVDCIYEPGAGLINGRIVQLINNYAGNGAIYDTVIYMGGANDEAYAQANYDSFSTYFSQLKLAIDTKFPNAKNKIVMCAGQTFTSDGTYTTDKNRYLLLAYRLRSLGYGFSYMDNAEYILRNDKYLEADLCHPNATGVDRLGEYIAQYLMSGAITVKDYLAATLTDEASRTYSFLMNRCNNVVSMTRSGGGGTLVTASGTSIPLDNNYHRLGTFDHSIICQDNSNSGVYAAKTFNPPMFAQGGGTEIGCSELFIKNNELGGYLSYWLTSGQVGNFVINNASLLFEEF